ncbi:MAG: M20/M25/M40 family metallo-hydrolase [Aquabacterium sp.]
MTTAPLPPAPVASITALLADLVALPSRAGLDDLAPVARCITAWFEDRGLRHRRMNGPNGEPLGLVAEITGGRARGPWVLLDATLDTADFGDPTVWTHAPTSARVEGGWLHGRGSADSKAGVALFAHLLLEWAQADRSAMAGHPQAAATRIDWIAGWPPNRVPDSHPMVAALQAASLEECGVALPARVVGPSNIGNYLAGLGVPALCGYGVHGHGIHATDERVRLDSIGPVYRVYRGALRRLFGAGSAPSP